MKKLLLLTVICLIALNAIGQREETLLSNMGFSGAWGSWISAIGKVKDENVYFRGGYGGLEFGKDIFLGWGGYRSSGNIIQDDLKFHMKWNGPVMSYSPKAYKAIHPIFTLMIANGKLDS